MRPYTIPPCRRACPRGRSTRRGVWNGSSRVCETGRCVCLQRSSSPDELVLFYQPVGQLVLEVITVAAELGIRLGHDRPLSAVVVRPCRSTGQLALLPFDILLQSAQPVRIVDLLAGGQREEILDAQVDADPPLGSCFRLDVHVEQEHETVRPVLTFHRPAGQALDRMA